jgi:hypothetical protein
MSVSIPRPAWRAVQSAQQRARERAGQFFARVATTVTATPGSAHEGAGANSRDWSSVMTEPTTAGVGAAGSPRIAGPAAAAPAPAAPVADDAAPVTPAPAREPRVINTAWVLPVIVLAVCLTATGWLFAHGTAAVAWLIALLVLVFAGVPIALVALRLFGYEDSD